MKVRINISISEEANSILNKQANKSQYLENLILGNIEPTVPSQQITEERVIELIKQYTVQAIQPNQPFVPQPPNAVLGYPCCQLKRPCKHWLWNDGEALYENTITGEKKKDESVVDIQDL